MLNKLLNKIKENKKGLVVLTVLLLISGIAHGYNMFRFPYYESDEGTYMSQAWSLLAQGELAPYTYWYDHAPVGWMLIALWVKLTGGFFTFGSSINSGRVLILLLHLGTSYLLFYIAKKLSRSYMAGIVAVLIFSLSPLGIYFQRRILLDNIMVFWVVLSFAILFKDKLRLSHIIFSSIAFGIGVLTKENAIFFIPAFLYLIFDKSHKHHKEFALIIWLAVAGLIIFTYFLYAALKGELFPTGTLLGGTDEHVSLLETLKFQANRGKISIFNPTSSFWGIFQKWFKDDPITIALGVSSTLFTLLLGIKNKAARISSLFAFSYWVFLLRGGLVLEFYITPLIPFVALTSGVSAWHISQALKRAKGYLSYTHPLPYLLIGFCLVFIVGYSSNNVRGNYSIYKSDQTTAQAEAVNYILSRSDKSRFYVIDNYAYLDLNLKNNNNFEYAEYYWKVDKDKEIRDQILGGSYKNIDYIAFTPLIGGDLGTGEFELVGSALADANPIISFDGDGWYVQIWAVKNPRRILSTSWESYKTHFISDGRAVDPQQDNATTSEAQSYALLRAVWLEDKETFDEVYQWTQNHLRLSSGLFSWKWEGSDNSGSVVDNGTATDADQDIALALLFAYKQWGQESYLQEAEKIINVIWQQEVVTIDGTPYLTAGNWANHEDTITLNPSYLSPATYKIFAEVDTQHSWLKLADSSYQVLQDCTTSPFDKEEGVLPPEWCALDKDSGETIQSVSPQPAATEYSYNAFRTPWRVALDHQWFEDTRAKNYLESLSFLSREWEEKQKLSTAYQHDGSQWEEYESVSAYAGNLGYFSVLRPEIAQDIYSEKILNKFYEDENQAYWEDPKNYYAQNWAWFGTALYSDNLPNLWHR